MTGPPAPSSRDELGRALYRLDDVGGAGRYQLLTSLVVPRPIGWISTRGADGTPNVAPFSFFSAISAVPMLISLSIGVRRDGPKDSLRNIRDRAGFCVNIVTEDHFEQMNETAAEHSPQVDEFVHAGLPTAEAELVEAPYVATCPAVLECKLYREIDLAPGVHLVIGEVVAVRLDPSLALEDGTLYVDSASLKPVARLGGSAYSFLGDVRHLERP